jgi:hypothetical protein
MDTDPLWPLFVITHVGGIVVGAALASLWWPPRVNGDE